VSASKTAASSSARNRGVVEADLEELIRDPLADPLSVSGGEEINVGAGFGELCRRAQEDRVVLFESDQLHEALHRVGCRCVDADECCADLVGSPLEVVEDEVVFAGKCR
jgi:hypothetical protein